MIERVKSYPAYKNSGVNWLGDVPAHWRQLPGKACFREKKVPNVGMVEDTVLSLSFGRIVVKPEERLHGLVPESFETYQIVDPGDIIIRPTDLQNDWNSLRVGLSRNRGIITSAYLCFATTRTLTQGYGYSLLNTYDLLKVFYGLGSGLRQNLDWRDIKYLPCLAPPLAEQTMIVAYLDYVDQRIRRHIRDKQELVRLLDEQKQAIIQQAVTRGLDSSVPTKKAAVNWLDQIPEHWNEIRAKYLFHEVDERSMDGTEELLSVSHITGVTPRSQKTITMFMASSYAGHKLCRPGDLVINTMWAWMAALGVSKHTGIVSPAYGVYRPLPASPLIDEYADLVLKTKPYVTEYLCRSTGIRSSRLRLYPEQFLRIEILCPPVPEQHRIVEWVRVETATIERALELARNEISLLAEYRTRLISDVVTGKLDVREAAARLPDEADDPDALDDSDSLADEEFELDLDETDEDR